MSLLTMIQGAARKCGIAVPGTVVGNSDENTARLLAWAQVEGAELRARHLWTAIRKEATFTSVATESQGALSTLAPGYDYIIPNTIWNRSTQQPVSPITPQDLQLQKASAAAGPFPQYHIRSGEFNLFPVPTAGHTYAFEYASLYWCQSSGAVGQEIWAADTDTGILSEALMELGTIWRWKKSNGLDYGEDFNTYENRVNLAISRDDGPSLLSLTPRIPYGPFGTIIVPEGNWNL